MPNYALEGNKLLADDSPHLAIPSNGAFPFGSLKAPAKRHSTIFINFETAPLEANQGAQENKRQKFGKRNTLRQPEVWAGGRALPPTQPARARDPVPRRILHLPGTRGPNVPCRGG